MMAALRRVLGVPGVLLGVWLVQAVVALGLGTWVRRAVARTMGDHAHVVDGHLWQAFAELIGAHPGLWADIQTSLAASAVIGALSALLLAGGIFVRLAGQPGFWAACGRYVPAVTGVTLMHLIIRGPLLVGLVSVTPSLPTGVRVGLLAVATVACTFALDVARARVILDGVSPRGPAAVLEGFGAVLRHRRAFVHSALLSAAQYVCLFAAVSVGIGQAGQTAGTVGPLVLSLVGVGVGLWRVAIVVLARR